MKNLSIKFKITVWFAVSILLITGITMGAVIGISGSVIRKDTFENLIEIVEENADEVEYVSQYDRLDMDDDYDIYLQYKDGYLEIDDDFVRTLNGIVCSVYDEDGNILYGEDILYKTNKSSVFGSGSVETVKENNRASFYYFDKRIDLKNNDSLWLRGVVSADYGNARIKNIIFLSLWILPALFLIAVLGGYLVAGKSLSPIDKISLSAQSIREGNDLTKRIELENSSREVQSLSNSFNGMLDRLEKSFRSEQQLTNDVSHELRTPVSVIMSQCEFTLEKDRTPEEYKEALNLVFRQSKKMSGMINDMLSFSRLEKRELNEGLCDTDFSELIKSVCDDLSLIRDKGITVHCETEDNIIINGDSQLLTRLAVNLISNAYRYGKENGNIYVSLKSEGRYAALTVRDDGIGIAKEDIEKIWDRFYRADKSRSDKGTGLGLCFVREIARIHGADVSVSSSLGEGTAFTFKFLKKI
ncbi:MAG: sensor histidine kinase [Acutalibacteraceae bacterium]